MNSHQLAQLLLAQPDMPVASHASNHTAFGDRMVVVTLDTYRGQFLTIGNFTLLNVKNGNERIVDVLYEDEQPAKVAEGPYLYVFVYAGHQPLVAGKDMEQTIKKAEKVLEPGTPGLEFWRLGDPGSGTSATRLQLPPFFTGGVPDPAVLQSDGLYTHRDDQSAFFKELVERWKPLREESDRKKVACIGLMMDRGLVDWLDDRLNELEGPEPDAT